MIDLKTFGKPFSIAPSDETKEIFDKDFSIVNILFTGDITFHTGGNIVLKRKDKSKVGEIFHYVDDGYDEAYIIEEEASITQISFHNDLWNGNSSELVASTGAIYVAPDLRNKGIGTALVKYMEEVAIRRGVKKYYIMHADNDRFWKKMGYTQLGRRLYLKEM